MFILFLPDYILKQNLHINVLELLAVIVCLQVCVCVCVWRGRERGAEVQFYIQASLREICFIFAV